MKNSVQISWNQVYTTESLGQQEAQDEAVDLYKTYDLTKSPVLRTAQILKLLLLPGYYRHDT